MPAPRKADVATGSPVHLERANADVLEIAEAGALQEVDGLGERECGSLAGDGIVQERRARDVDQRHDRRPAAGAAQSRQVEDVHAAAGSLSRPTDRSKTPTNQLLAGQLV